mgnify:CR=1 FL=1
MSWDFYNSRIFISKRNIKISKRSSWRIRTKIRSSFLYFRFQYQSNPNLPKSKNLKGKGEKIFWKKIYAACDRTCKKGCGYTNPNPLVGAVIVKDQRVIGEGYHEKIGGLHAERNALKNCIEDPEGAEIYVTLEPCCHYGKTPPCTEALIEAGIKKYMSGI